MRTTHAVSLASVACLAGLALSSCGGAQAGDAEDTVADFVAAVGAGNGPRACSLLAPATERQVRDSSGLPCPEAILEEASSDVGPQLGVSAYGTMAQVRFQHDTVFVTRFDSGWRVLAAACSPPKEPGPYDCQIEGG